MPYITVISKHVSDQVKYNHARYVIIFHGELISVKCFPVM